MPEETPPLPPPNEAAADPFRLEYFAATEPDRIRARRVLTCSLLLVAGWVPYVCRIVNAVVAAQSYSQAVTRSHTGGSIVFMGAGLLVSAVAIVGFIRLRHGVGVAAGALVLCVQVSVCLCLGLSVR